MPPRQLRCGRVRVHNEYIQTALLPVAPAPNPRLAGSAAYQVLQEQ